ncbi:class I SAM-dependent methyltransferase [Chthonobacter rhizosphaerae]|uniref:class I SAM-dependent methyltransferase n=1 Tax=Chthonobacter rhizosphaerae TaxID=2735553 RepID=UPI0015EEE7A1|nr:class I SAM-dependent methyltransferase [Chthonobacter rhizosphaerae]
MTLPLSPVTGAGDPDPVLLLPGVPVLCNQLWPDAASARGAPAGDVDLVLDRRSGLLWNRSFDPDRMAYAAGYENALHHSPAFRAFADDLARGLVGRHDLKGRDVLEIGCGDGHMLALMMEHGARSATGYDPSMAGRTSPYLERPGVSVVPEYFKADRIDRPFDAILCRHVLEHLDDPAGFLADIRAATGDRTVPIYFEVPNADWILSAVSLWDVIYEHVTYWTAPALETLMRRAGFRPLAIGGVYGDQFLMVEAVPDTPRPDWLPDADAVPLAAARAFGAAAAAQIAGWRGRLSAADGKAVIWGAGSKGITFANALGGEAAERVAAYVDLNPRKHGRFAPGVGLPVVEPAALPAIGPALVLMSNALYRGEISGMVARMGLRPTFGAIVG